MSESLGKKTRSGTPSLKVWERRGIEKIRSRRCPPSNEQPILVLTRMLTVKCSFQDLIFRLSAIRFLASPKQLLPNILVDHSANSKRWYYASHPSQAADAPIPLNPAQPICPCDTPRPVVQIQPEQMQWSREHLDTSGCQKLRYRQAGHVLFNFG